MHRKLLTGLVSLNLPYNQITSAMQYIQVFQIYELFNTTLKKVVIFVDMHFNQGNLKRGSILLAILPSRMGGKLLYLRIFCS